MAVNYFQKNSSKGHERESLNHLPMSPEFWESGQRGQAACLDPRKNIHRLLFASFFSLLLCPWFSSFPSPLYYFPSIFSILSLILSEELGRERCPCRGQRWLIKNPPLFCLPGWISLTFLQHWFIKESVHFFFHYCHRQRRKDPVSLAICPWHVSHLWSQSGISF